MAQRSTRLDLIKPDLDDNYNINVYNSMIDTLDAEMVVGSGVLTIVKLTQSEYDAITTPDAGALYVITGDGSFKLALGGLPMEQSGGTPVYDNFSPMLPAIRGSVMDDFEEAE